MSSYFQLGDNTDQVVHSKAYILTGIGVIVFFGSQVFIWELYFEECGINFITAFAPTLLLASLFYHIFESLLTYRNEGKFWLKYESKYYNS